MDIRKNPTIIERYCQRTPGSASLGVQANTLFPSGVTHDSRYFKPHPLYIERATGSKKWDTDGNQYIDYYAGHGSLLLGNAHPEVTTATQSALENGSHFAASHRFEIAWASAVKKLMPGIDRIRFTSSGTEATLMALRLARAKTGKTRILRFRRHFHGWHDDMASGFNSHFDGSAVTGVAEQVALNTILLDIGDIDAVAKLFTQQQDIAAVILEPLGATTGRYPLDPRFLHELRELTSSYGVALIFDEVITGFRVSKGGVQTRHKVEPDITALAKILSGGLPGGAVAGNKEYLDYLDHNFSESRQKEKVYHPGTFNANPISSVAGSTALNIIDRDDACDVAERLALALRNGLNQILVAQKLPWHVYGESSMFHIGIDVLDLPAPSSAVDPLTLNQSKIASVPSELIWKLRLGMFNHGIDIGTWPGGFVSSVHSTTDIEDTVAAFDRTIFDLKTEFNI